MRLVGPEVQIHLSCESGFRPQRDSYLWSAYVLSPRPQE